MGRQVHVFANIHNLFQTICQTPDREGGEGGASSDTVALITSLKNIIGEAEPRVITRNAAENRRPPQQRRTIFKLRAVRVPPPPACDCSFVHNLSPLGSGSLPWEFACKTPMLSSNCIDLMLSDAKMHSLSCSEASSILF